MAEKTPAQIAEEARRKGLTQEQRDEEDRRAKLSQEDRDAEDLANVDAELMAENAAQGTGTIQAQAAASAAVRRQQIVARMKASAEVARRAQATETVTVARGRHVYLTADQKDPYTEGAQIKVTPDEAAQLRAAGHLKLSDGTLVEPAGPKVYQESGLIQGHGPGQGQAPEQPSGQKTGGKR